MTEENWERMTEAFAGARQRVADERETYLREVCAEDPELRTEVQALLAAHEQSERENFLESEDPMVGQTIGDYRVEKLLSDSEMGKVYLAVQDDPYMRVAIKIVKPGINTEQIIRQFKYERRLHVAVSHHPNVAGVMYAGSTDDGRPYFVMEYVEGQRIDHYCDIRKLTIRDRIMLFRSVLDAVEYAHQNLVIHLDLKPSNILMTNDGVPKLLDFGIARLVNPDLGDRSGPPIGLDAFTPAYASPEQVRRDPVITTASDVYSLGVVLYELLTGHRPYQIDDQSLNEVERIICQEHSVEPSIVIGHELPVRQNDEQLTLEDVSGRRNCTPNQLRRHLERDIDYILLHAMRKEPQRRFEAVAEFSDALQKWLDWRPVDPNTALLERLRLWCKRDPIVSALTSGVIVLVLLVAVVATVGYVQTNSALTTAEDALEQAAEFRRVFVQSEDFKNREMAVLDVAKDSAFLELFSETIHDTRDLRDRLNDPTLERQDREQLIDELQSHPARKALQQRLQELRYAHDETEPIYNWLVLDSKGLLLAREPARPEHIGHSFCWRKYFHGGPRDYIDHQDYLNNAGGKRLDKPHLSVGLESQSTGRALWAISAPIEAKADMTGVVGLRVAIGAATVEK